MSRARPMKRLAMTLSCLAFAASAHAAPTLIGPLDKLAAQCNWKGGAGLQDAKNQMQKDQDPFKYQDRVAKVFKDSASCVSDNLAAGKAIYVTDAKANPAMQDKITDYYSAWVYYMNSLKFPKDLGEDRKEAEDYEKAKIKLQSQIDLM